MGERTAISWTDHTFNPWWGCTRVSPGCQNCYAETFAKRTGHHVWGQTSDRRFFGDKHWAEPLKWDRAAEAAGRPALVFCASMADVFEDRPDLVDERDRLWDLVERTPHLIWQLLTKRPENVSRMVPWASAATWPSNVWIGTTAEDQQRADERIPELLRIPAPVRFLSCEPLLGPVDLTKRCGCLDQPVYSNTGNPDHDGSPDECPDCDLGILYDARAVDWIIAGGESGPRHRPLNLDHARHLRDQAVSAGVPFLFKQVGGQHPTSGGDELDGARWHQFPPQARR